MTKPVSQEGLSLNALTITLNNTTLFDPLSITVAPGEIVTVMGDSGSGKSTLLSAICGTLNPVFDVVGTITLNGVNLKDLPPQARKTGILFQDDLLFPHLTVGENLAFGIPPGLNRTDRKERIQSALFDAGLEAFADRDPATLSGGQRARVACLRALLAEPKALLLDEPFSKLDAGLRDRFRQFVFEHALKQALPVLLVTHDPADAEAGGGKIVNIR